MTVHLQQEAAHATQLATNASDLESWIGFGTWYITGGGCAGIWMTFKRWPFILVGLLLYIDYGTDVTQELYLGIKLQEDLC